MTYETIKYETGTVSSRHLESSRQAQCFHGQDAVGTARRHDRATATMTCVPSSSRRGPRLLPRGRSVRAAQHFQRENSRGRFRPRRPSDCGAVHAPPLCTAEAHHRRLQRPAVGVASPCSSRWMCGSLGGAAARLRLHAPRHRDGGVLELVLRPRGPQQRWNG